MEARRLGLNHEVRGSTPNFHILDKFPEAVAQHPGTEARRLGVKLSSDGNLPSLAVVA